jgi:hypothetical protein
MNAQEFKIGFHVNGRKGGSEAVRRRDEERFGGVTFFGGVAGGVAGGSNRATGGVNGIFDVTS